MADDEAPLRQRVKEWGEAADVWTKALGRVGGWGVTFVIGDALIRVFGG